MAEQLYLWSRKPLAVTGLAEELQNLQARAKLEYAEIEWWNAAAELTFLTEILQKLRTAGDCCLSGNAWGEIAEVRWRRSGQGFWLAITSSCNIEGLNGQWQLEPTEMQRWHGEEPIKRTLILWGTQRIASTANDHSLWMELRIPRELSYPVIPQPQKYDAVFLDVREYQDAAGQSIATRRSTLRAIYEEKEKVR